MKLFDIIISLQEELNSHGENLTVDGQLGPKTRKAMENYDFDIMATRVKELPGKPLPFPSKSKPPWYAFALQFKGKKETDPELANLMVPKWKLFGMDLGTIATSWSAWCGLAMAVCLSGVGVDYAKNGALAANWAQYGISIDWKANGIPQGAIVQINHTKCGSSSGNHVAVANGDCSPADMLKKGASIDLYGGNQGNTWKVSRFAASEICAVRWPKDVKDFPVPPPVTKSLNCTSEQTSGETTR